MRPRPAKLKDVAEAAGVSISTVSRVFSHPERLSPQTTRHVLEVAQRLRYSPNPAARALITGTSPNIGLVVPDISNPYMTTLLKAAQTQSRHQSIGVFVADTDDSAVIERQVCEQLAQQCRGVVLCAPRMSTAHIREIAELMPLVLVNRVIDGISCVYTDSRAAMRELLDGLHEQGHRRVAYLQGPAGSWANKQRARTLVDRARDLGVELVLLDHTAGRHGDGIEAAARIVDSGVTAVLAFDDVLAAGLVEGLRRLGKSVPGDISVTGHDDVLAELVQPGLTTVNGQSARVGQLAVANLLDDTDSEKTAISVNAVVVRRSSTAPVQGSTP
jgi:LacI family transcriptional regulator